jgi:hypothetical protein
MGLINLIFENPAHVPKPISFTRRDCRMRPMIPRKLAVLITGGALGLVTPVGVVKWVPQTEP